jgi:hypothetical protein
VDDENGGLTQDEFLETVATEGFAVAAQPQHEQPADDQRPGPATMAAAVAVGLLVVAQARVKRGPRAPRRRRDLRRRAVVRLWPGHPGRDRDAAVVDA